jgi:hypothetical protein
MPSSILIESGMIFPGRRLTGSACLLLLILLAPHRGAADPVDISHPDLARALAYYERGDYARAANELGGLIGSAKLQPEERVRAWEALGISAYVMGKMLDADRAFRALLAEKPAYQPDPIYVAPEIVAFILDVKRSAAAANATTATTSAARLTPVSMGYPQGPVNPSVNRPGASPQLLTRAPASVAPLFSGLDLLPFGAAQFRKSYGGRGATLLTLQSLFLGSNLGLYYYRHCALKESCAATYYPAENTRRAQDLQALQIVSGSLFLGTAVLGVVDGVLLPLGPGIALQPMPSGAGVTFELE